MNSLSKPNLTDQQLLQSTFVPEETHLPGQIVAVFARGFQVRLDNGHGYRWYLWSHFEEAFWRGVNGLPLPATLADRPTKKRRHRIDFGEVEE